MPVISVPQAFNEEELYVDLQSIFGHSLFLKCEGFNFAGSIKLKAATEMVETAERHGLLMPGSVLVESSSGNLGVALSMIAASRSYRFLCVTDSRCNLSTRRLIEALGCQVHVIAESDAAGGFSECRKIATLASAFGVECVPHAWGSAIGLAATVQFLAAHGVDRRFTSQLNQINIPGNLASDVLGASSAALSFLATAGTITIVTAYLIIDARRMDKSLYKHLPAKYHHHARYLLATLQDVVGGYIRGQIVTSTAITIYTLILLLILRVPNAIALSFVAARTTVRRDVS